MPGQRAFTRSGGHVVVSGVGVPCAHAPALHPGTVGTWALCPRAKPTGEAVPALPCGRQRGASTGECHPSRVEAGNEALHPAVEATLRAAPWVAAWPGPPSPWQVQLRHGDQAALGDTAPDRDTSLSLPSGGPFGESLSAALSPRSPRRGSLTGEGRGHSGDPGRRPTWHPACTAAEAPSGAFGARGTGPEPPPSQRRRRAGSHGSRAGHSRGLGPPLTSPWLALSSGAPGPCAPGLRDVVSQAAGPAPSSPHPSSPAPPGATRRPEPPPCGTAFCLLLPFPAIGGWRLLSLRALALPAWGLHAASASPPP